MEKREIFERNTKPRLDKHPEATASLLTDDLILEILSRLPARSLHRFKRVSVSWRNLIADPTNRKRLRQTLAGFLYRTLTNNGLVHHFAGVSGDGAALFDPSLPYLHPNKDEGIMQEDACNGLLLYRCYKKAATEDDFRFVVCNPATGRWVELPPSPQAPERSSIAGLAFDPAVSSHFHVLHFEETYTGSYITGVNIYSSRTGVWCHMDCGIVEKITLLLTSKCVFVGGLLYLMGNLDHINNEYALLGVDIEGKVWKTIHVPYGQRFGTIGSSQGCLHYAIASVDDNNEILDSEMALWCLNDRDSKEFVLKHTVSIHKVMSMTGKKYIVVGIHPDGDTIFLLQCDGDTLVSFHMRHQEVGCILDLEKGSVGEFLPYVPLFSESFAGVDGH